MSTQVEEIRKFLADKIGTDTVSDDRALKDLGLDSLDVVEMCLDLEDKYGIQFATEELAEFKTVGDLLGKIDSKIASK
ncbi:MAG: phosphopantetheine-binding protein [Bacilli bacterium]|nr:phosphopantetheine-binding protein [Bacilli bacterium]